MIISPDELTEWKKLISQLPYILSVQIVADENGNATEIHVLAGEGRSPKQIMRDIQSAIMAKFQKEIDHKIISIAQIPAKSRPVEQNTRFKYTGLDMSLSLRDCRLSVELELAGKKYSGSEVCELTRICRYRAIVSATLQAVNDFLGKEASVNLEDVKLTEACGQPIVVVAVSYQDKSGKQILIGTGIEYDDIGPAAIKATLDALNRKISLA